MSERDLTLCECPCHTDWEFDHPDIPCCTPCLICQRDVIIGFEETHHAACASEAYRALEAETRGREATVLIGLMMSFNLRTELHRLLDGNKAEIHAFIRWLTPHQDMQDHVINLFRQEDRGATA